MSASPAGGNAAVSAAGSALAGVHGPVEQVGDGDGGVTLGVTVGSCRGRTTGDGRR